MSLLSNLSLAMIVRRYLSEQEKAGRWASTTRSWLNSFFCRFTFLMPSLPSSGKNQIPDHSAAPASHGGVSLTRKPAADGSISIVVDALLLEGDQAVRTSAERNPCGNRSTTTAGNSRAGTFDSSQQGRVQPIADLFQSQELGKSVMGFAMPMTTGLLYNKHQGLTHLQVCGIALALLVGFAATWNGVLLRGIYPRAARVLEHCGVASIFVAFFGLVSSFVPQSLVWACWLCCASSCLPILLSLVSPTAVEEERCVQWLDQGIVQHEHVKSMELVAPGTAASAYNNSPRLSLSPRPCL